MRANPWISRSLLACGLLVAAVGPGWPPARAGNITYNFNSTNGSEQGWYSSLSGTVPDWQWNLQSSNKGGGWQTFTGTIGGNYGAYLTSPCMVISNQDQQWVNVRISHRYNFPLTGTTGIANQLGQVQFRVNNAGWQGVPEQYFVNFNGNPVPNSYPPNYGPPGQTLFSPLITTAGTSAWSDTTLGFDTKDHQPSEFTLFFTPFGLANGDEIEFRFLMATDQAVQDPFALVWEINNVKIDGVEPCVVPEPGTLALAAIGVAGLLVVRGRRRVAWRKLGDSAAVAVVIAAVAVGCVLAARPAEADVLFDFQLDRNGGVTSGTWTTSTYGSLLNGNKWIYKSTSPAQWGVLATGADNPSKATGALLTSPAISGTVGSPAVPAINARISIAHSFWLPASGTGPVPINAGQLQYRLNGAGSWIGLPLSAFTSGTSVNTPDPVFGDSPFYNPIDVNDPLYVDQTAFVFPSYVPPTGTAASLPPLVNGGASFVGQSAGFASQFVPSQAFLNVDTGLVGSISSLELRFVEANLNAGCPAGAGWNIRMVSVDFASTIDPVPEPATLALAAFGGATCAARALRRRSPSALEAE